jgi:hypothetical protein
VTSSAEQVGATPEQVVSEARAVTLAEAARLSGRSVQALRQRIARGSLRGCEVQSGGATVAGIELGELVRAFGQLSEPDELPQVDIPRPSRAEQPTEQGGATAEGGRERPEQRAEQGPEREEAREAASGGTVTAVSAAVTAWRDAREALVQLRTDHARELERAERQHGDALRWGRAAVLGLVVVLAGAAALVVRERDRAHAAQLDGAAATAEVRIEAAAEVGSLRERAAAAERQAAEAQLALECQERAARAMGEGLARVLRGGG